MKRLTNEKLKKEFRKVNNNLIIALVCLVLGFVCIGVGFYAENRTPKDTEYLNDIIDSDKTERENLKTNIKVTTKPVKFKTLANNRGLYFSFDGKFLNIISLTDSEYNELIESDLENEPVTIYGTTKLITSDIKSTAKTYYNRAMEESQITTDEQFYNNFGDIYLETNEDIAAIILIGIGALCMLMWTIFILVFIIMKVKLTTTFKKIDDEELRKIEEEIDDKEAFHYEKAHLILTKNYIISFLSGFKALKYEDIIWLYEYRLRQYGMTTQKSIMVMDKTGKVKPIITLDGVTKKSKLVFDEIAETILSKNNKILVGYNKENKKRIKEEYNF